MKPHLSAVSLALGLAMSPWAATANGALGEAIYSAPVGAQAANKSARFAFNPELGRAWVEVTKDYSFSDSPPEVVRVPVPGLSYDAARGAVVLRANGEERQCATVAERGTWVFKSQVVEPTGQCELAKRYVKKPVDDGFAVDRIEQFEVFLKPAG